MSAPARVWSPRIQRTLALMGVGTGTPEYQQEGLRLTVEVCQERHAVSACRGVCPQFEFCDIAKEYLILLRYAPQAPLLPSIQAALPSMRTEGGSVISITTAASQGASFTGAPYWPNPGTSK